MNEPWELGGWSRVAGCLRASHCVAALYEFSNAVCTSIAPNMRPGAVDRLWATWHLCKRAASGRFLRQHSQPARLDHMFPTPSAGPEAIPDPSLLARNDCHRCCARLAAAQIPAAFVHASRRAALASLSPRPPHYCTIPPPSPMHVQCD